MNKVFARNLGLAEICINQLAPRGDDLSDLLVLIEIDRVVQSFAEYGRWLGAPGRRSQNDGRIGIAMRNYLRVAVDRNELEEKY